MKTVCQKVKGNASAGYIYAKTTQTTELQAKNRWTMQTSHIYKLMCRKHKKVNQAQTTQLKVKLQRDQTSSQHGCIKKSNPEWNSMRKSGNNNHEIQVQVQNECHDYRGSRAVTTVHIQVHLNKELEDIIKSMSKFNQNINSIQQVYLYATRLHRYMNKFNYT